MTRLSDSLRGLADRAPVDAAVVSVGAASSKIHRNRRLRAGANITAGLGAATVIAFAAINPGSGSMDSAADAPMAASADDSLGDSAGGYESGTRLAWGTCGSYPFAEDDGMNTEDLLTLAALDGGQEGGSTLALAATLSPASSGEFETFGPQALVLWDGMVVAAGTTDAAESYVLSTVAGEPIEQSIAADLANCWDGAALPGGTYEIVAVQELYTTQTTDPIEPTLTPEESMPDGTVTGGIAADGTMVRVVSEPVKVTITGDPVDDPFAQYLPQPIEPVDLPDDILTPAVARDEFAAHLASATWNMAKGTQRVTKTNDSADPDAEALWAESRYGCTWEDGSSGEFPAVSAEWSLLDVTMSVPSAIDVSYGWVVENNPKVDASITNMSGHTLSGYWDTPNASLYLVRDGKVVAEAYPVSAHPYTELGIAAADGMLAPQDQLTGEFLWRDVNGCWADNAQTEVGPGTYTVLNVQNLYVDAGQITYYEQGVRESTGGVAVDPEVSSDGGASSSSSNTDMMIAPAPPTDYDAVEFQVWTSLGTLTVR